MSWIKIMLLLALIAVPVAGQYPITLPDDEPPAPPAPPAPPSIEEREAIVALLIERFPLDAYEVAVDAVPAHPLTTDVKGFEVRVESTARVRRSIDDFYGNYPFAGTFNRSEGVEGVLSEMERLEMLGCQNVGYNHPSMRCLFEGAAIIGQGQKGEPSAWWDWWYVFTAFVPLGANISENDIEAIPTILPSGFTFFLEGGELTLFSPEFPLPETAEGLAEIRSRFNEDLDEYRIIPELRF